MLSINIQDGQQPAPRENELRLMVDTMPVLAWSCLPDGAVEFLNQRWLDYTGLSLQEGGGWGWKAAIHPDDLVKLMNTWLSVLASGEPGEEEARLRRFDGEYRWFLFRAVPVRDRLDKIVRWNGTNTDIEDLKRAEYLLAAEKRTLEMIASGASLTEILDNLCRTIDTQSMGASSTVLLMDLDGKRLWPTAGPRVPSAWTQAITPLTIGPCVGSCGTAAFLKEPVITEDITTDPLWADYGDLRQLALSQGIRSSWSQPLISKNHEVLGTFAMYYAESRSPSGSDLRLIEGAGHIALIAIERWRSEEALRESEEKIRKNESELRRIVDLIPQIIVVGGPDGTPLYANGVMLDYTGVSPDEVPGAGFGSRLSHPEDVEKLRTIRQESLIQGVPFQLEQRMLGKDGNYRWFLFRYNPLRDEDGQVARWYVTATDIHDRKQVEERIQNENLALREEIDRNSMFEEILGTSEVLRAVLQQVAKVAPTDSTVLILGETGTGKELIARAIHKRSKRSTRPFIRVNCAAIPPSLIASELFGHEKGAFTGALQRRLGRFEAAAGGTIFLDEIGELPMEAQIALLRVLQEREIERVGSNQSISVDVRVLTATNRNLRLAVDAGIFREDLFYRLNVVPIEMPSLRQRVEDISLLVEYFVERYAKQAGKKIRNINKKTLALFQAYSWPGNVRELQNVIERAVVLCDGDTFSVDATWIQHHVPVESARRNIPPKGLRRLNGDQEREMIETALADSNGRISGPSGAATKLGIPRQTLESKITSLGINKRRFMSA